MDHKLFLMKRKSKVASLEELLYLRSSHVSNCESTFRRKPTLVTAGLFTHGTLPKAILGSSTSLLGPLV